MPFSLSADSAVGDAELPLLDRVDHQFRQTTITTCFGSRRPVGRGNCTGGAPRPVRKREFPGRMAPSARAGRPPRPCASGAARAPTRRWRPDVAPEGLVEGGSRAPCRRPGDLFRFAAAAVCMITARNLPSALSWPESSIPFITGIMRSSRTEVRNHPDRRRGFPHASRVIVGRHRA